MTAFKVLETHISWVILTGELAYKIKKPVSWGFVDFSTLDLRHGFCLDELRLNRRLAPDLYLGISPIYGSYQQPTFVGSGTPIEFAIKMRQFDQASLLPAVLGRGELRPDHIDQLATTIAEFHQKAATAEAGGPFGTPAAVSAPVVSTIDHLESSEPLEALVTLRKLRNWTEREFELKSAWFQERLQSGWIRECHGDLHLGNLVLLEGVIRPFDCLEFNPELRWIDVISEIAFLVMDLQEHGRADLALRLLNRWLEQTGDFQGLRAWRWYMVYRALVRAKVAALRLQQPDVDLAERQFKQLELASYIKVAASSCQIRQPPMIVMHGLSGSGKSHVAQWVCEQFGAIQLRSDVERKRLYGKWGWPAKDRPTGDMYSPEVTETVYRDVLAGLVPEIISAGFPIVVDAAFLVLWQRSIFRELAQQLNVPFILLNVRAKLETMRNRLQRREATGSDPSDASISILDRQRLKLEPLSAEELQLSLIVDTESAEWEGNLRAALNRLFGAAGYRGEVNC